MTGPTPEAPSAPPPQGGAASGPAKPDPRRPLAAWWLAGLLILTLLAVPPLLKNYGIYLFTYWLVFIIATMGLNLTVGYA